MSRDRDTSRPANPARLVRRCGPSGGSQESNRVSILTRAGAPDAATSA
jgi:hypothetical protein